MRNANKNVKLYMSTMSLVYISTVNDKEYLRIIKHMFNWRKEAVWMVNERETETGSQR